MDQQHIPPVSVIMPAHQVTRDRGETLDAVHPQSAAGNPEPFIGGDDLWRSDYLKVMVSHLAADPCLLRHSAGIFQLARRARRK